MKFLPLLLLLLVSCRNDIVFDSSRTVYTTTDGADTSHVFWRITISGEHLYFGDTEDTITWEPIYSRKELPGSLRFKTHESEYIVWYKYGNVESIYTKPKFGLPRTYLK